MANQFYSRAHYRRVSPPADTSAQIAERKRRNALWEQVAGEVAAKFPIVTTENAPELLAFQQKRVAELGLNSVL